MSTSREQQVVLPEAGTSTTAIFYPSGAPVPGPALILAHGAGAGQRSPFMTSFARAIASRGIDVFTFDFPYMADRRRLPDRGPVLEACFQAIVDHVRADSVTSRRALFVGGKSMGGRIGSQLAAHSPNLIIAGLVLLGYPLHPPGKPHDTRDAHLPAIRRPMLFVQGSRDAFGTPAELQPILNRLDPQPDLRVVQGGDHSFKVSGGREPQAARYEILQEEIAVWIHSKASA